MRLPAEFKKRTTLRPISREDKFEKLRSMRCFQEVHQRIVDGWQINELARWIQQEKKEYTHVVTGRLVGILQDYRASLPAGELLQKRMPGIFHRTAERMEKTLDELEELVKLYKLQKRRMMIDAKTEKKINKLMPTMTQEVRVAREILQTYADLKMDLGVNTRHIGQIDVDAKLVAEVQGKYGKESIGKVLSDPQSRQKVLGVAEKFLALAAIKDQDNGVQTIDAEFSNSENSKQPVETAVKDDGVLDASTGPGQSAQRADEGRNGADAAQGIGIAESGGAGSSSGTVE